MINAVAGVPFEALALGGTPGLVGTITVEVYDPSTGAGVVPATTVGITEPRPGTYRALLTVVDVGTFVVRWDDGTRAAEDELVVAAAADVPVEPLPPGAPPWAPTVLEVASVTPAYTAGGFDDDRPSAGAQQTDGGVPTYTDDTEPSRSHVEGLIVTACDEVAGRVGVAIPLAQYALARTAAKWHVASVIEGGKEPANTDDATGAYRAAIANFRNSLDALIVLCRMPTATRLR